MAKLSQNQIRQLAKQIVLRIPAGIRRKDLHQQIASENPETSAGAIGNAIWNLEKRFPNTIHKPSRGLYLPTQGAAGTPASTPPAQPLLPKQKEEDFYQPFAECLRNDLDEATVAVPLGGAGFQKKWGTPDVVGVYKPLAGDRIKFDIEIIAAETKIDPQQPVVAFGQAAAYRLFSTKSYVVMPVNILPEDYSRLEALCLLFGIGLVVFQPNPQEAEFEIRVRAQRFYPDMFYVNEFAERMYQLDKAVLNQLFG